ncbi:Protein of unknown function [Pyronema omphalodes CBS 100304]|uniref:Uncharacterized protein n=1 Tax=Pyronema omphalodes (strain CBS 100304) TaxID=1076935 RepID=U4LE43_PYROM|nr:Protein of unknown function [Pyronema omphalodes CBS 100304]
MDCNLRKLCATPTSMATCCGSFTEPDNYTTACYGAAIATAMGRGAGAAAKCPET